MVAGTNEGRVVFWKNTCEMFAEGENWQPIKSEISGSGPVRQLCIGNGLVAARFDNQVVLVQETVVTCKISDKLQVLQLSCNKIRITAVVDKKKLVTSELSRNLRCTSSAARTRSRATTCRARN